jgi:hypothetical protein
MNGSMWARSADPVRRRIMAARERGTRRWLPIINVRPQLKPPKKPPPVGEIERVGSGGSGMGHPICAGSEQVDAIALPCAP